MSGSSSTGELPRTGIRVADAVIDAIADIEIQRQETERQAGFAMSCSSALHRLNELHDHEAEASRLRGPNSGHQANVQAVSIEIARVKGLSAAPGLGADFPGNPHSEKRQEVRQKAPTSRRARRRV